MNIHAAPVVSEEGPCIIGSLYYGDDERVAEFVSSRIPHMIGSRFGERNPFTGQLPYAAIGVVRKSELVGGIVFYNYRSVRGQIVDIEMSGAFEASDWCRPSTLRALFSYPFSVCEAVRLTTITGRKNKRARRVDEGLGFKLEGVARRAIDGREDAMIYGMLREECYWVDKSAPRPPVFNLSRNKPQE